VRQQLRAVYATHHAVRARVRIREVRMIDGRAWVASSGEITGRVRVLGTQATVYQWADA
jgi:hypothetical protein